MQGLKRFFGDEGGNMITAVGKASLAIGFLSLLAANWLSRGVNDIDKSGLAQLAATAARPGHDRADPMTTGSLSSRAGETRLDPCVLPPRR